MTTSNAIATSIPTVSIVNNQAKTSSKAVAEFFGKRHSHILEKIESLDCSPEFASANFSAHVEIIKAGAVERESKYYEMTKNGFVFLVMGFTGKRAAQFKEAYIKRFDEMEIALHTPLALNDGEHYFVVKDGVVLWEKVLKPHCNDLPANTLKNPALMLEHIRKVVGEFVGKQALPAPKQQDKFATLQNDLEYFLAPENPRLEMGYHQAQDALTCLSTVVNILERNGLQLGLMYQKTNFVRNLLSSYWSRLDSISSQLNEVNRLVSGISYAASVQMHPSIVTTYGTRFG